MSFIKNRIIMLNSLILIYHLCVAGPQFQLNLIQWMWRVTRLLIIIVGMQLFLVDVQTVAQTKPNFRVQAVSTTVEEGQPVEFLIESDRPVTQEHWVRIYINDELGLLWDLPSVLLFDIGQQNLTLSFNTIDDDMLRDNGNISLKILPDLTDKPSYGIIATQTEAEITVLDND